MSINKDAIQYLEQLLECRRDIDVDNEDVALLPEGVRLQDLQVYHDTPRRQKSTFKTSMLDDFIEYVSAQANDRSIVFVDPQKIRAQAIFDFGNVVDPGWKENDAALSCRYTPEYAAAVEICEISAVLSQRQYMNWLEDWRDFLAPRDENDNDIAIAKAISAIGNIDVKATANANHSEGNMKASESTFREIGATSGAGNLPASFLLGTSVYEGLRKRLVEIRPALRTGEDRPKFTFRIVGEAAMKNDISRQLIEAIRAGVEGTDRIYSGIGE